MDYIGGSHENIDYYFESFGPVDQRSISPFGTSEAQEEGLYKKEMHPTYNIIAYANIGHQFEYERLYEKNMYNNCPTVSDEIEEIMNQYIRDTDAEYRERNRANIGKSVERFNRSLIEKYGAENLDPEDFLVINKEQYLIGEFEDCFKECQKKVEKKFQMGIPNREISYQKLPKEMNKESCAECGPPVIILNDTLREMLSHPNYSEVISSFLANVDESYHMGEAITDTINCSDIVTSEKYQSSVTHSNDSDNSTTHRVTFHTINVDDEFWSKDQRSSPLDDPSKLKFLKGIPHREFANILSTDNNHVSISDTSKGTCDSILYKRVSQLIDETTIITSSWDAKCLSQMMLANDDISPVYNNDDIKLRYGELPDLEYIYSLECSTSSINRKTQEHYYFDKSKKSKPIFVYSTIHHFTTRPLSIQISSPLREDAPRAASDVLHSMISNIQDDNIIIPHKYVDVGSLIQALEWICLRWKHRRKVNGNMIAKVKSLVDVIIKIATFLVLSGLYNSLFCLSPSESSEAVIYETISSFETSVAQTIHYSMFHWMYKRINYSLVSNMRKSLHLRCGSLQQRISLKLKESCSKMNKISCNLIWWINNR